MISRWTETKTAADEDDGNKHKGQKQKRNAARKKAIHAPVPALETGTFFSGRRRRTPEWVALVPGPFQGRISLEFQGQASGVIGISSRFYPRSIKQEKLGTSIVFFLVFSFVAAAHALD